MDLSCAKSLDWEWIFEIKFEDFRSSFAKSLLQSLSQSRAMKEILNDLQNKSSMIPADVYTNVED